MNFKVAFYRGGVHLEQWFLTFDGVWLHSRDSQHQWPPAWLENKFSVPKHKPIEDKKKVFTSN